MKSPNCLSNSISWSVQLKLRFAMDQRQSLALMSLGPALQQQQQHSSAHEQQQELLNRFAVHACSVISSKSCRNLQAAPAQALCTAVELVLDACRAVECAGHKKYDGDFTFEQQLSTGDSCSSSSTISHTVHEQRPSGQEHLQQNSKERPGILLSYTGFKQLDELGVKQGDTRSLQKQQLRGNSTAAQEPLFPQYRLQPGGYPVIAKSTYTPNGPGSSKSGPMLVPGRPGLYYLLSAGERVLTLEHDDSSSSSQQISNAVATAAAAGAAQSAGTLWTGKERFVKFTVYKAAGAALVSSDQQQLQQRQRKKRQDVLPLYWRPVKVKEELAALWQDKLEACTALYFFPGQLLGRDPVPLPQLVPRTHR